jgi:hypothetical protein
MPLNLNTMIYLSNKPKRSRRNAVSGEDNKQKLTN